MTQADQLIKEAIRELSELSDLMGYSKSLTSKIASQIKANAEDMQNMAGSSRDVSDYVDFCTTMSI